MSITQKIYRDREGSKQFVFLVHHQQYIDHALWADGGCDSQSLEIIEDDNDGFTFSFFFRNVSLYRATLFCLHTNCNYCFCTD